MAYSTVATWKLTKWTGSDLIARVPTVLKEYGKILDQQFKEEIKAVNYEWTLRINPQTRAPMQTKRRNGQLVGSPRDIVDLGGFLRSQSRDNNGSPTQLIFKWSAPYANLIYNGYTTSTGYVARPRNWIKPALEKRPLDDYFRQRWLALASNKL